MYSVLRAPTRHRLDIDAEPFAIFTVGIGDHRTIARRFHGSFSAFAIPADLTLAAADHHQGEPGAAAFLNLSRLEMCPRRDLVLTREPRTRPSLGQPIDLALACVKRAYHLWVADGCGNGNAEVHWLSAQREVLALSLESLRE